MQMECRQHKLLYNLNSSDELYVDKKDSSPAQFITLLSKICKCEKRKAYLLSSRFTVYAQMGSWPDKFHFSLPYKKIANLLWDADILLSWKYEWFWSSILSSMCWCFKLAYLTDIIISYIEHLTLWNARQTWKHLDFKWQNKVNSEEIGNLKEHICWKIGNVLQCC